MTAVLYVTPTTFKPTISLPDGLGDEDVELALAAASGAIDEMANRRFWLDPVDVTRTYTARSNRMVVVDDLAFLTSVESNGVAVTDVKREPVNANLDGKPYLWLISPGQRFSCEEQAIEVTGRFGWPETPSQVRQFVTIVASKLLKRSREAPWGVVTGGFEGPAMRLAREDPDCQMLLRTLTRHFPIVA